MRTRNVLVLLTAVTMGLLSQANAAIVITVGDNDGTIVTHSWDLGDGALQVLGRETLALERAFNRAAGFTPADDRLPEWMTVEPLPPHDGVFDVPAADLDGVFDW